MNSPFNNVWKVAEFAMVDAALVGVRCQQQIIHRLQVEVKRIIIKLKFSVSDPDPFHFGQPDPSSKKSA